mmetsp:Transcript_6364/g.19805  ORF Transcript_6364/g.19805 Transcript_6364/m.19805 type:complete len:294 (+) Transcript_6364:15-896(+)
MGTNINNHCWLGRRCPMMPNAAPQRRAPLRLALARGKGRPQQQPSAAAEDGQSSTENEQGLLRRVPGLEGPCEDSPAAAVLQKHRRVEHPQHHEVHAGDVGREGAHEDGQEGGPRLGGSDGADGAVAEGVQRQVDGASQQKHRVDAALQPVPRDPVEVVLCDAALAAAVLAQGEIRREAEGPEGEGGADEGPSGHRRLVGRAGEQRGSVDHGPDAQAVEDAHEERRDRAVKGRGDQRLQKLLVLLLRLWALPGCQEEGVAQEEGPGEEDAHGAALPPAGAEEALCRGRSFALA